MVTRPRSIPKLFILAGPTASGKTEVALELSKRLDCEVISCDSMQVYKSMPIVTQAATSSRKIVGARRAVPLRTHLVSFVDPTREYSAALFRKDAEKLIGQIMKKGRTPLITAGTGLYVRALLDGLFDEGEVGSGRDEALRKKLVKAQETHGGHYLHERLKKADPAAALKIHPNDTRRLVRALEVYALTKRPISELQPKRSGLRAQYDPAIFLLDRDRADLYDRINRRVDRMLKDGLVNEVKKLSKKKLSQTAAMALGIREIKAYLDGTQSLEQAIEQLKMNTRRYAKRQLSWFRHERDVVSVPIGAHESAADIADRILSLSAARRARGDAEAERFFSAKAKHLAEKELPQRQDPERVVRGKA